MPAPPIYLLMEFARGISFTMLLTVAALYRVLDVGLDPMDLMLLGVVSEAVRLTCEVPTGVVADLVSRRLSIIIGFLIGAASLIFEGLVPQFWAVLIAQALWGLSDTFISGANVAWITDEIGEERAALLYARGMQASMVGGALGIASSIALGAFSLALPLIVAGGILGTGGLILWWKMPEEGFSRPPRPPGRHLVMSMREGMREGIGAVRGRPVLLLALAVAGFLGMASESVDRLWEMHLLTGFALPVSGQLGTVATFGLIIGVGLLLGALASGILASRLESSGQGHAIRILFVLHGLLLVAQISFGMAPYLWLAVGSLWLVLLLRALQAPVQTAWINQGLDSRTRATVNSMVGQANALGQIAGGPLLGVVAVRGSVSAALMVSGLAHAPVLGLLGVAARKRTRGPDAEHA